LTTPFAVALGFLFPVFFGVFRPYIPWLFGLMTFTGALKLKASELGASVKNPLPIAAFFITSHIFMPLTALFITSLFFTNHDIITGYVLLFAGPTAVSGFIWIMIYKGDKALGLSLILLSTILAPLIVPATIRILMGKIVVMDMSGIALSLLLMIVVPTILGVAINETSKGKVPHIISASLDPFSKICLILVIAANTSAVAHNIKFNDPVVWMVILFCIVLTTIGFLFAKLNSIIVKCNDEKSTSLILSGGLRNNSAVMTIAVAFFPEMTVLPTLMSIITQQSIAALIGKLLIKKKLSSKLVP
jgi:tagaturonate reductase